MEHNLPMFIAFKSVYSGGYAKYMFENDDVRGLVRCGADSPYVYNPYVKIAVETSEIDSKLVHLRFTYSNKYWALGDPDPWIFASSDQPEEDTSKSSCTLFQPTVSADGVLQLIHVQSGGRVRTSIDPQLYVDQLSGSDPWYDFTFVDLDTLVVMPKHVAFKGDNDMYLRALWFEDHEYLQFSSTDGVNELASFEITMLPDGYLRIKCDHWDKFWNLSTNWIWANSTDTTGNDINTLFWPVKVDDNTIALRSAGNDKFCKRLSSEGKESCLSAEDSVISKYSHLQVEELVLEREVYDVIYHMEYARIFDEKTFVAGTGAGTNDTNEESSITIPISFENSSTHTFSNSVSIMTGVVSTFTTGIPFIEQGEIQVSTEVTSSFEWNRTTTETKTEEKLYTVVLPPMSTVTVKYVGTRGTCNIPFSYAQRDRNSLDGSFLDSQNIDGIFTGVNNYNLHFAELEVVSLLRPIKKMYALV